MSEEGRPRGGEGIPEAGAHRQGGIPEAGADRTKEEALEFQKMELCARKEAIEANKEF